MMIEVYFILFVIIFSVAETVWQLGAQSFKTKVLKQNKQNMSCTSLFLSEEAESASTACSTANHKDPLIFSQFYS